MPNLPPQNWNQRQRLAEFYRRLDALPRATSAEKAFKLLCDTLEEVEDEMSGMPKQTPPPPISRSDGRMYCPLEDHVLRRDDGSMLAMTRGHRIEIDAEGAIRILNRFSNAVEFES